MLGRHAGSDHIDAVEARLRLDLIEPSMPGEMTTADRNDEVLGHLSFVENRADRQTYFGSVTQGSVPAPDLGFDPGQFAFTHAAPRTLQHRRRCPLPAGIGR